MKTIQVWKRTRTVTTELRSRMAVTTKPPISVKKRAARSTAKKNCPRRDSPGTSLTSRQRRKTARMQHAGRSKECLLVEALGVTMVATMVAGDDQPKVTAQLITPDLPKR